MKGSAPGSPPRAEVGAGTVMTCGLALVIITLIATVVLLAQVGTAAARAATAADLAALAAADASRGLITGEPCTIAVETAAAHGAFLESCIREGQGGIIVEVRTTVQMHVTVGGYPLLPEARGRARAGPPP
ncbi:Rv3654c family TadE-like protein [Arthrobacter sp. H20]|uniref:Rv3654c family TadE-like protein n=1 Tax=Arthrobacter sp. H20 TaxID=1267981 RepID=UPI00047DEA15|nr:Rv3654c family TadE-like protein [Arthrobacter sp. H20]